jgi:hypothetical protein
LCLGVGIFDFSIATVTEESSSRKRKKRIGREREKKFRDPQDVLIEADRLRKELKKQRTPRRGTPRK